MIIVHPHPSPHLHFHPSPATITKEKSSGPPEDTHPAPAPVPSLHRSSALSLHRSSETLLHRSSVISYHSANPGPGINQPAGPVGADQGSSMNKATKNPADVSKIYFRCQGTAKGLGRSREGDFVGVRRTPFRKVFL